MAPLDRFLARHCDAVLLLARFALGLIFVLSGFGKLMNVEGFATSLAARGVPMSYFMSMLGAFVETFGGLDITVRRNAFGRQRESFETDLDFKGLDFSAGESGVDPVHAVFIRGPWVERVGPDVEILAQVDPDHASHTAALHGVARIVAVRSGHLLATSFHPEVTGEKRVHELFIRMIRGEA